MFRNSVTYTGAHVFRGGIIAPVMGGVCRAYVLDPSRDCDNVTYFG